MTLDVVDLFCGAGGLAEGFREAGMRIVAAADSDPDACATFQLNFPEAQLAWGDVRDPAVGADVRAAAEGADVIIGGPPCQAFSQVRNHDRIIDDPRNALYREFVSLVDEVRPRAFVMENVPGMREMGADHQVVEDLSLSGVYRVSAHLLDAADFGVPQTRKRLFFIGLHEDLQCADPILEGSGAADLVSLERRNGGQRISYGLIAAGCETSFELLERLEDPQDLTAVTAEQALSDLDHLRPGEADETRTVDSLPAPRSSYQKLMRDGLDASMANLRVPRINRDTVLRLEGIPPGGNYRDLAEPLTKRYITGQRWGPHSGSGQLDRRHYYAYRRLHPRFWSWTLNTKADSVYHYRVERALTVREFARLQSFPDRFTFTVDPRKGDLPGRIAGGRTHSLYRQVGNAVPPALAAVIATEIRGCL